MITDTTIPDANGVARDQLRAFVQRIERVEEEIASLNSDKSDIYKEAAGVGFDKKTLKKVVARRKVGDDQRQEEDALFETYWNAVHGVDLVHARVRENIEKFDAEAGEILDGEANAKLIATVVTGMQTEIGRKALVTALDIMIEREEEEERRSDNGLNIQTKHEDFRTAPETAEELSRPAPLAVSGGEPSIPSHDAGGVKMDGSKHPGRSDDMSVHKSAQSWQATTDHKPVSYRQNCLHPKNCASGTTDHCWSCRPLWR